MADKSLTYSVKIDLASAQAQAQQLRALFQQSLQNVQVNILDPSALNSATSATNAIRAQYQQIATAAQTANQALGQAGTGSAQQTRAAYDAIAKDAQQTAQSMQQAASQKPQTPTSGGVIGGGLGSAIAGGLAGYLTIQGAQKIAQEAVAFAELGTQVRRADIGFKIISGSAAQAQANLAAVKNAAAGTVTTLAAEQLATQALNLHLATTSQGLADITRNAREIALISPTIHDMGNALTQLSLFASNPQSFQRADQLGLGATEVKDRMKALQDANSSLDDSQAKLLASSQILDEKFGALLDTTEAQASGVEKLKVAFSDMWAEVAKGAIGGAVDEGIGDLGNLVARLAGTYTKVQGAIDALKDRQQRITAKENGGVGGYLAGNETGDAKQIATQQDLLVKAQTAVKRAFDEGIPTAGVYKQILDSTSESIRINGQASEAEAIGLGRIVTALDAASRAHAEYQKRIDADPEGRRTAAANQTSRREDMVSEGFKPIKELAANLHDIGVANFFQAIEDGLMKSAELTATATNGLTQYRQELEDIATRAKNANGNFTPDDQAQVKAIQARIDALTEADKLNKQLQQAKPAAGQDLEGIYTRLNTIIAQAGNTMSETATKARLLGDAIAQSGSASAEQMAQLGDLAAQANQADFSRVAQSLQELNQGSLDAVPGVSALREELTGFYDTLASGQGLTDEQAATLAGLAAEADALGGSTSALSDIQSQLGFKFLESHDYAAALVEQIANLSALYGAGSIGADQFAGGMGVLTSELYRQLAAAGALSPELIRLIGLLNAVHAAAGGGGGLMQGPTMGGAPLGSGGGFFGGFGGGGSKAIDTGGAGYKSGQAQAEAAAALARSKADTTARDEMRKANDRAARGAQSAFENAASATQKAFKDVTDKIIGALEKVPGLFKTSDVTKEQMDQAKAGIPQNFADDFVRRFADLALNNKNSGVSADQVRDALGKIGVQGSGDNKALLAQLKEHWNDSSLFANKDNLKLINADAVKGAIDLQSRASEGKQNILEYFGATIDAVKEKFKAGDPDIVAAVADDLAGSNDKNIKAMGDQLKAGGQQIIDKVLALAQASIDKTVGSLGSGASDGGGGGITVPAVSVGPTTGKAGTTGGTAGYLDGTTFAGGVVPVTAQITNILPSATPLAPIPVTAKVTGIEIDPAQVATFTSNLYNAFAGEGSTGTLATTGKGIAQVILVAMSQADMSVSATAFVNAISSSVGGKDNADNLHALGVAIDGAIQSGFINVKRGNEMATAFTGALSAQFGGKDNAPTYGAMGDTISYLIESGFIDRKERLDMATAFINALNSQFGAKGGKGEASKLDALKNTGQSLSLMVESGFVNREDRLDMAGAFSTALSTQFATASTNYGAIGDSVSYLIESGVANRKAEDRLDMATPFMTALSQQFSQQDFGSITKQIQDALNGASLDKETEGADGKTKKKPAMDFSSTASQITGSLSKAMGGQADFLRTIGDNASTFIGFGMTDHDFSATASTLIGSMTASFTTEQARTQLIAAGAALSGAVFAGFQQSLAYSPWLSAIVAEVVSQAATSLNSSLQDSLKPQALGF